MASRVLQIRNALVAALRATAPGGLAADAIFTDLRQALGSDARPAIVVDLGDEDAPVKGYGLRSRSIALTARILADGNDPFATIDPIRIDAHAAIMGGMTADGLLAGGAVTPADPAFPDRVDVAALSCMLGSVETRVAAAAGKTVSRPAADVAKINSITVDAAGAISVVSGTDGFTDEFSGTRGAAGGPPILPTGSIEIAEVRFTTHASAVVMVEQIVPAEKTLRAICDSLEEGASGRDRADLDVQIGSLTTAYLARYTTGGESLA